MRRLQYVVWMLAGLCAVPGWASLAQADEVFICDGNTVVRVALKDLDAVKRTNPCVAAHYGLTVMSKPVAADAAKTGARARQSAVKSSNRAKPSIVKTATPRKPVSKTNTVSAKTRAVPHKTRTKPAKTRQPSDTSVKVYKADEALPVEEVHAKPSDYRNIRVLNGKSKPAKWYRHVY